MQITEQLSRQAYSKHCQKFKNSAWVQVHIQFWGAREVLWNYGTLINILSKTQEEKAKQGNILEFFLLDTLKTIFWIKIGAKDECNQGLFSKVGALFSIFKKGQLEGLPLSLSCASVSVAEYASISLNLPKFPWKCLSKLFWQCHNLNIPDYLTC